MTRWTIAQLRDKEKYDAWKDDDELIEVDEVDADKAKDKARIQELEEVARFYADWDNWKWPAWGEDTEIDDAPIMKDKGEKARVALRGRK